MTRKTKKDASTSGADVLTRMRELTKSLAESETITDKALSEALLALLKTQETISTVDLIAKLQALADLAGPTTSNNLRRLMYEAAIRRLLDLKEAPEAEQEAR